MVYLEQVRHWQGKPGASRLICVLIVLVPVPYWSSSKGKNQSIEHLHAWLSEEGERKKTADHSEAFSPLSFPRLNTDGRLAPVAKVEAERQPWLSIASCVWTECVRNYIQSYNKIIKSIIACCSTWIYRPPAWSQSSSSPVLSQITLRRTYISNFRLFSSTVTKSPERSGWAGLLCSCTWPQVALTTVATETRGNFAALTSCWCDHVVGARRKQSNNMLKRSKYNAEPFPASCKAE